MIQFLKWAKHLTVHHCTVPPGTTHQRCLPWTSIRVRYPSIGYLSNISPYHVTHTIWCHELQFESRRCNTPTRIVSRAIRTQGASERCVIDGLSLSLLLTHCRFLSHHCYHTRCCIGHFILGLVSTYLPLDRPKISSVFSLILLPTEIQLYRMSTWDMWGRPAVWSWVFISTML